jgi:hypothetical protein
VHGCYPLHKAALEYCFKQDPECMIIYGGDACDRGPDGYKIMRELLENPQIVYLKGNHEDMFVAAARFILNDYHGPIDEQIIKNYLYSLTIKDNCVSQIINCIYNGGMPTLTAWMLAGMPNDFVSQIDKLPLTFSTDTIDFCHAGTIPKVFNRVAEDEYNGDIPDREDAELLLWDRNMLGYGWAPNRICVYGHTPTPHLPAKYYGKDKSLSKAHPCKYVGNLDERLTGAKVAMDVATANTNKLYVLNCLTLKAQGFIYNEKNNRVEEIEVIQL